jgi:hypothetical protein
MQTTFNPSIRIFATQNIRVMNVKLTLTVNKATIEKAKKYAQKNGKSISSLVENYLNALVIKDGQADEYSPAVMKLLGSVNAPSDFNYKAALSDAITNKHLK